MKKLLTMMVLLFFTTIKAQTNDQEAQLTYQLAQEAYDNNNFEMVLRYLDKVEQLNSHAKVRSSYLKAKSYYKLSNIESYEAALENIRYYINNGKDEEKITELLKIKIYIENSDKFNHTENVTIGSQVWTIQNLDVATYRDGTPIPQVTTTAWANLTTGAWCYYENSTANGKTYGKLYNWYAVAGIHDNDPNTPNKVLAPSGWHVPTDMEWTTLIDFLGGKSVAGGKMKATGTLLWATPTDHNPTSSTTNSSGFTGLPGGRCTTSFYTSIGTVGEWWSSTENSTSNAWSHYLYYNGPYPFKNDSSKAYGFSVRCVKD